MYENMTSGGSPVDDDDDVKKEMSEGGSPNAPKKAGRRKINIEFIEDKSRRHITFSKRKAGIMKKAYELSTLTGTQVLLLVASETGHVYTFATPKLQPLITKPDGKNLIQSCLNAPEEHRMPNRNQQEHGKGYPHGLDVASVNGHMGLNYGAQFQPPSSGAPMIMGGGHHPHPQSSNNNNMPGYPHPASRYMPPQAGGNHPSVNNGSGASNQYPPFASSVAGMMAQFPSQGFGGPSNQTYALWPHSSGPVSGNNQNSNSHDSPSKNQNDSSHHSDDNLQLQKD